MKKFFCVLCSLLLFLPCISLADVNYGGSTAQSANFPWSDETFTTYSVSINPSDSRVQSYCGPSRDYHGAGGYKTYKVERTDALFIEDGFVLVDMQYETAGHRRVYFPTSAFADTSNVPLVTLTSYSASVTCNVTPKFGPSSDYVSFDEAAISSGTSLSVFFQENGYVYAEFNCGLGSVRSWIPAGSVTVK